MNCKNCQKELPNTANFCPECGAKVITERINTRTLLGDIFKKLFGWDNRFLFTMKEMIVRPGEVLSGFLSGVRQKYSLPFTFFGIAAALSLLVISQWNDEYRALNEKIAGIEVSAEDSDQDRERKEFQNDINTQVFSFIEKNWNFASFLLLPLYTLIAYWVYGGPYNFGEHLVINAYIQGPTFMLMVLIFLFGIWIHPQVYSSGQFFIMIYYAYAYAKLYHHSFGMTLRKFFKFVAITLGLAIGLVILGFLVSLITAKIFGLAS